MAEATPATLTARFAPVLARAQTVLTALFEPLVYVCLACYGFAPQLAAADLGWHLAQADWMLTHGAFLRHDVFNYINLNAPLINEYPLYQVIIWLAWRGGEIGAAALCATLLVLAYSLYFRAARQLQASRLLLGAGLLASLFLSLNRSTLRPELATTLGIAFFTTFLLRHREARDWKQFWPLALVQALWVNSHSGFILGPTFILGFGLEMILRDAWRQGRFPRATALHWTRIALLVLLACLLTPYGPARLWLPFYHQGNELIRAYVTEMQPLTFDFSNPFVLLMLAQLALITIACLRQRGGLCWSFLAITMAFFYATFTSERHLAVFAFLAPGVILSANVFSRRTSPVPASTTRPLIPCLASLLLVLGVLLLIREELNPGSSLSPIARWRDWNQRQTELPHNAVEWMKAHRLNGRLFHRSEFGGWLQYVGYNRGQTYCDTGFGKYNETVIREIGRASEQPASLPALLRRYQPNVTLVANMGYNWPYYLQRENWRCVYYAPDGSVWVPFREGEDSTLATVSPDEITQRFTAYYQQHGLPARAFLYYRQLLTLHSMGLGTFASAQLLQLPENWQSKFLFWEVARKMIATPPALAHTSLSSLLALAEKPDNRAASLLFRATFRAQQRDWTQVIALLNSLPRDTVNDTAFTLLAEALLETNRTKEAAALLRNDRLFTLANDRRYKLLARVETQLGHPEAAARANERAHYFGPIQD